MGRGLFRIEGSGLASDQYGEMRLALARGSMGILPLCALGIAFYLRSVSMLVYLHLYGMQYPLYKWL